MRRFLKMTCWCVLLAVCAGGPVRAENENAKEGDSSGNENEPSRYEDEITVTGADEPSLTVESPEDAEAGLAEVPGGTGFVDAEEYKRGRASTLADALGFSPGVFVQPRFGSEEARLSIRGSGLQRTFHGRGLELLQDGVPLNLADGGFDFQAVEPLSTRYIEVFRGPNGLEHGSATLGGAINYVSPTGHEALPVEVRTEAGSFGYLRGQVAAGGVHDQLDYYATLTHSGQDGFREHAVQSTQRFFGNLGLRHSDRRESRLWISAVRTDSELPGSLTKAQLAADPGQASAGNLALDQKRDFDLFRLAGRTTFLLSSAGRLDLSAFWASKQLDHPIFQVLDQDSDDFGLDLRWQNETSLLGRPNRLVIGLRPAIGFLRDERFVNVAGSRGAPTAAGDTTSTNLEIYAEEHHELRPGLSLILGLQAAQAERKFEDDFLSNGDQTDDQDFSGTSPKLGIFWQAGRTALFANVSRSFEPPSFGELANLGGSGLLQLDAQTATSVEAGTRGSAGPVTWDVVLYHSEIDGELLSLNDAVGNPLGTINADRTVHAGVEVGWELRVPLGDDGLRFRHSYTWSRFEFDGDAVFGDNQLAGMPAHFHRAELLWERPVGFYGGPSFEWVPEKYPVDHANTLFADPYKIFGLKVGYRPAQGIAAFVEARNLTDETYAATTGVIADARGRDSAQFLPGDGRSFFAGLEYRWGEGAAVTGRQVWLSAVAAGSLLLLAMSGCGSGDAATPRGPRASFPGRDPNLRMEADGTLHIAYVEEQPGGPAVFYRRLGYRPLDAVRVSPAGLSVTAHGETPPALEVLPGGALVVAYPVALPGKWKNEIRLQRSSDGGAHWSAPALLHAERHGAHSFLSSTVTSAGEPVFAWLDDSTGHMGLHVRRGEAPPVTLDAETCECCGTALLAGPQGQVWLAYRDAENDVRDFRLLRADRGKAFDSGKTLSADGWKIQGCPHTGARLAQGTDGTLSAVWFTAGEGQAGIYAASSNDGGATFSERALVTAAGPGRMVRHPELGSLPGGGLVALYEAEKDGHPELLAQVRDPRTGNWEQPRPIAAGGKYPRWAAKGKEAVLAFTCGTGESAQVVVADWDVAEQGGLAGLECAGGGGEHSGH